MSSKMPSLINNVTRLMTIHHRSTIHAARLNEAGVIYSASPLCVLAHL